MVAVRYDYVMLDYNTGLGANSSGTYVLPDYQRVAYYDSSKYVSPTVYLEGMAAAYNASNNHTWMCLYNNGSTNAPALTTQESESAIEFTSTTPYWVRSAACSITSGYYYCVGHMNEGTARTTVVTYSARLVIIDDIGGGLPSKITTRISLGGILSSWQTTTGTSYTEVDFSGFFSYDATYVDGTINCYMEVWMKASSGATAYAELYTVGGSGVTASETTTTSTGGTNWGPCCRSGAFSLSDDTEYILRIKASSGGTTSVAAAFIIVEQTGTITKARLYQAIGGHPTGANGASYSTRYCPSWLHTSADWGITTQWTIGHTIHVSNAATTGYNAITVRGSTTAVTNTEVSMASTTKDFLTNGTVTLSDATAYALAGKVSNTSYYTYMKNAYLYTNASFSASVGRSFAVFVG